jgi:putative oxidoreductase
MRNSQAQHELVGKQHPDRHRTNGAPAAAVAVAGGRHAVPLRIRSEAAFDRLLIRAAPAAAVALRLSLGLIFVWFGALKLAGDSPVAALVSATLPWANPAVVVPVLGAVEVALGIGLLIGRARRLLLLALATHLAGTFLTFLMAPGLTVQGGNPLLLTADGEFVLKNAVLISAAVLLACTLPRVTEVSPELRTGMP